MMAGAQQHNLKTKEGRAAFRAQIGAQLQSQSLITDTQQKAIMKQLSNDAIYKSDESAKYQESMSNKLDRDNSDLRKLSFGEQQQEAYQHGLQRIEQATANFSNIESRMQDLGLRGSFNPVKLASNLSEGQQQQVDNIRAKIPRDELTNRTDQLYRDGIAQNDPKLRENTAVLQLAAISKNGEVQEKAGPLFEDILGIKQDNPSNGGARSLEGLKTSTQDVKERAQAAATTARNETTIPANTREVIGQMMDEVDHAVAPIMDDGNLGTQQGISETEKFFGAIQSQNKERFDEILNSWNEKVSAAKQNHDDNLPPLSKLFNSAYEEVSDLKNHMPESWQDDWQSFADTFFGKNHDHFAAKESDRPLDIKSNPKK